MTVPYYVSAEQMMRDRSELAKKGIARGRSVIVMTYADGVLFVAENPSRTLHKISELYDRIGFAAVGKYNEFESLRRFGINQADKHGYEYDRKDVSGQSLANLYALYLGSIFTEQPKPYEVELCVAEISPADQTKQAQLYRVSYDGSIVDEPHYIVMGGATESILTMLKEKYEPEMNLEKAITLAVDLLGKGIIAITPNNNPAPARTLQYNELEIACLDHSRSRRAFIRVPSHKVREVLI